MQAKAFPSPNELLCSDTVLGLYSLEKAVAVACDSYDRGCGTVLYHVEEQGLLKPIMYVSKAFSEGQRKWTTFEKVFRSCFRGTEVTRIFGGKAFLSYHGS